MEYPDLGQEFNSGVSLAERIAGRKAQQGIEQQNADTNEARMTGEGEAEQATRPGRIADMASQQAYRDASTRWMDSRAAALDSKRPGGAANTWDTRTLATRLGALEKLKTYGSDYFGAGQQAEYDGLQGEYNKRMGFTPAVVPPPKPGMLEGFTNAIGDFSRRLSGQPAAAPAASEEAPTQFRTSDGGKVKWGLVGGQWKRIGG